MIKKTIAIIALVIVAGALTALITPAFGSAECGEEVYMPSGSSVNLTFTDASLWAISDNHFVIGKKSPTEAVSVLPPQSPSTKYVHGCVDTGLIREKASMKAVFHGTVCGLTSLEAIVTIKPEFKEAVESIIADKLGEEDLSAKKIIACTQVWDNGVVYHIFFTSQMEKVIVGYVVLNNGQDVVNIYMGDFDGDDSLELGFTAGWNNETPKRQPSPSTNAPCKTVKKECCGKPCFIQINIFSVVNNCFKKLCD